MKIKLIVWFCCEVTWDHGICLFSLLNSLSCRLKSIRLTQTGMLQRINVMFSFVCQLPSSLFDWYFPPKAATGGKMKRTITYIEITIVYGFDHYWKHLISCKYRAQKNITQIKPFLNILLHKYIISYFWLSAIIKLRCCASCAPWWRVRKHESDLNLSPWHMRHEGILRRRTGVKKLSGL